MTNALRNGDSEIVGKFRRVSEQVLLPPLQRPAELDVVEDGKGGIKKAKRGGMQDDLSDGRLGRLDVAVAGCKIPRPAEK